MDASCSMSGGKQILWRDEQSSNAEHPINRSPCDKMTERSFVQPLKANFSMIRIFFVKNTVSRLVQLRNAELQISKRLSEKKTCRRL